MLREGMAVEKRTGAGGSRTTEAGGTQVAAGRVRAAGSSESTEAGTSRPQALVTDAAATEAAATAEGAIGEQLREIPE